MKISVNGTPLALKKGSSFEYISENRLFSGSDDYTLAITFPLRGCPQNLKVFGHINRIDVSLGKVVFDCEIRDKRFYKFGTLTVVEISVSEVKCQFLEGRSEVNYNSSFDKLYINELDLGKPSILEPSKISPLAARQFLNDYVALPWVNNNSDSGLGHNFCHVNPDTDEYEWDSYTDGLSWQPYLLYITRKICEAVGYDYNFDSWTYSRFRYILVCNTLPHAWDMPEFARALPAWTITEYFEKLELFLGGEFDIDHRRKFINFRFSDEVQNDIKSECIENIIQEFNSEVTAEDSDSGYINAKNLLYKEEDSRAWKFYSCEWYVKWMKEKKPENVVSFETMQQLLDYAKKYKEEWWDNVTVHVLGGWYYDSNVNLFYVKEVDQYFVFRVIGISYKGNMSFQINVCLQNVNNIHSRIVDSSDSAPSEEIEFVPVSIDHTDLDHGFCMFLTPGSFDDKEGTDNYQFNWEENIERNVKFRLTFPESVIMNGEKQTSVAEYYDRIFVAYWGGAWAGSWGKLPCPLVGNVMISDDLEDWWDNDFSFSLDESISYQKLKNNIDPKVKYTFKFLADEMPDVRAVFYIRGKKYLCEKITASFSENGMSQLLKGEFYRIQE